MGVAMDGKISTRIGIFWLESVITNTVAVSKCCTSLLLPPNVDKQTISVPSTGSCSSLAKLAVMKDLWAPSSNNIGASQWVCDELTVAMAVFSSTPVGDCGVEACRIAAPLVSVCASVVRFFLLLIS